jgi:uncharacterized protein (DUF4415 family)
MNANDHDVEMLDEYDFSQATRGPVVPPTPGKTRITIRLDTDILDWFHERVNARGGGSYQTLINQALRAYITHAPPIGADEVRLREMIREMVREELARTSHQGDLSTPLPDDEAIARRPDDVLHSPATQENSLFLNQLFHAIHALPPEERDAVILCDILGYAEEADDPAKRTAATICGVTGRTIRDRRTRAAAKLSRFKKDL